MSQREAVDRTLASVTLDGRHDALVALVRALADRVDQEPEISARMSAVYLSAIRNLGRAIDEMQRAGAPKEKTSLSRLRASNAPASRAISIVKDA
ncbi:hypothetical protein [Aeromicrobium wangtongii]|uniref:hypothetical protein n=1 Tax=Aeromicrobium wangtongii TaxID=2969247 RepID=UPI002017D6FC|nr:hypothetical protein [Aeromicrobium wangtongii]MCL3818550.1 hypothetical protein [Aeromicrobium wangtongii]